MAFVSDAVALGDLIARALNFTQQAAWRWYKASTDRQVFQDRLTDLKHQSERWSEDLRKYGMESNPEISSLLKQACRLLDQEDAKNKELQSNRFRRLWTTLVFPEALTDAMEKVCSALERLPQRLADREAAKQLLERAALNQKAILPFVPDKKYVEFKTTIAAVRKALESESGGRVVMLSGGPGQGKTSMAKHLALLYQNGCPDENPPVHVRKEAPPAQNSTSKGLLHREIFRCCGVLGSSVSQDESSAPNLPSNVVEEPHPAQNSVSKIFQDGVFFYSCGPTANSRDILLRLWGDLRYEVGHLRTTEAGHHLAGSSSKMQPSSNTESVVKELTRRLANRKVLIVLDDVRHHALMNELLIQGAWVKFLITTQNSQLWMDANCVNVLIQNPTLEEAHQILRNHVPGFPAVLTPEIEGAIDAVIKMSEHNPLVLANVTKHVRCAANLEEWESARKFLENPRLHDKTARLSGVLFGHTYSKSTMVASVTMPVDSVSMQEQSLLFLASICEGQSIPEVVFKMLFKRIHGSLYWFPKCCENLESKNFIQIESEIVPWSKVPQRRWSLHATSQQVIDETKYEEITTIIETLLESHTMEKIEVALLVLYGQQPWRDQATEELMKSREQTKSNYRGSSHFSAIKPFVLLLQGDGEEEWEKESDHLVGQVVHHYMVAGELDDDGLSTLLAMQQTASSTIIVLKKMAKLKDEPIFTIRNPKTAHALLNVLECDTKNSLSIGHKSARLLSKFSFEGLEDLEDTDHTSELQPFPNLIERLSLLLAKDVTTNVQECAALALSYLSCPTVAYPINIASFPVALERFVAILSHSMSPTVRYHVVVALAKISNKVKENAIEIASFPGAIESLAALLMKDVALDVQGAAAHALACMSHDMDKIAIKIASCSGVIDGLVALLAKDVNPDVQVYATRALGELCHDNTQIAIQITLVPSAIDALVALLAKDVSPDVQEYAAWALSRLCRGNVQIASQIASLPGAIDGLVTLLAEAMSPGLQKEASYALGNLCCEDAEIAIKIASYPGAIHGLVALLAKDVNPNVQKSAAWALGGLTCEISEIAIQIVSAPSAIGGLVALLAKDVTLDIQKDAAWTLARLSLEEATTAIPIASFPGAINGLVALLARDINPIVQDQVVYALGRLCCGEAEIVIKIVSCPGVIDRLVALLAKDGSPETQEHAAWTLGKLSCEKPEIAIQIASFPSVIDGLEALLGKDMSPAVQEYAAWALSWLKLSSKSHFRVKLTYWWHSWARA